MWEYNICMSVRTVIQIGDPKLKVKNTPIVDFHDPSVEQVIADLIETMRANEIIGIAAPQIAENVMIFVTEPRETKTRSKDQSDELRIFINPKIIGESKEKSIIYEGCGSVLHGQLFGPVERPNTITIEAYDKTGKRFRFTANGILGRVIQHEYDHLHGVEFTEKISDYKKLMTVEHYIEFIKNESWHSKACEITLKKFEVLG